MKILDRLFPHRFVTRSLASHLSSPWAIEGIAMRMAVEEARERIAATSSETVRALAMTPADSRPALGALLDDGCYLIPVSGVIVRGDASCARLMGVNATGLEEIERALATAEQDARCTSICLEVDSPGGTTAGVQEIADMIAASSKKTRAEIAGQCASAAYWLISQCDEITAERSALVGSIGAFAVVPDSSRAATAAGIDVHVVRSAASKGGSGVPGAPVTPEALAGWQVIVDDLAALFVGSIAKGRGLSLEAAQALATGEVWIASKALAAGLIDGFTTPELDEAEPTPATNLDDDAAEVAASANTAPLGALTEDSMDKDTNPVAATSGTGDELARIRAELAAEKEAKAKADALLASFADAQKNANRAQMKAALDRHALAATFAPAERPSLEALSARFEDDPAAFVAHLDQRAAVNGKVTRETPAGDTPKPEASSGPTAEEERVLATFARLNTPLKLADLRAMSAGGGVSQSHRIVDTERTPLAEVK